MKSANSLKVLLVPDLFSWILGTWAKQIATHGKRHQYYYFSTQMRVHYPAEFEALAQTVDVVHVLTQHGMLNLPLPTNKALVGTIHHVVDWDELEPITQADTVCYVSNEWQKYLLDKGVPNNHLFEIRNGVDTEFFRQFGSQAKARAHLGINSNEFLVGFFGKYSSDHGGRKGTDIFVQTLDRLNQQDKRCGVVITGPGWHSLVRALRAAGLSVYYFPFLNAEAMPLAYNALDAYLITARIEGGPVPLLEAMACGIPVVSTRVGVVPELIEHEVNGLIIPKDAPDSGMEAILRLRDDRQLAEQIAHNGRQTILDNLQWRHTLKDIDSLYDQAVQNRDRRLSSVKIIEKASHSNNGSKMSSSELVMSDPKHQQQTALVEDSLIWHKQLFDSGNRQAALRLSFNSWQNDIRNLKTGRRFFRLQARELKRKVRNIWQHKNGGSPTTVSGIALREATVTWIHSMRDENQNDFEFRMSEDTEPTLLSQCFAILGLKLFDAISAVPQPDRQHWASQISKCYQSDSGLFIEPSLTPDEVPTQGHNWDYLTWQSTYFALMALDTLGEEANYSFPFLNPLRSPQRIQSWLENRDWSNPWLESNNVMFITSFLIQEQERTQETLTASTLEAIFKWLDKHQNPITGYWDLGQGASLLNAMAGAYHFYFLYFYTGRPVRYPERVIESTLSLQQPDGLFDPWGGGGACLDLDAVDILAKFSLLTDYRADAVKMALVRTYNSILENQNSDGGFCESKRPPIWQKSRKRRAAELVGLDRFIDHPWQGRPAEYTNYSSWEKMRYRLDGGDMWSTWFRPLALAMISTRYPEEFISSLNWQFPNLPALGWHNVTQIKRIREQFYS